MWLTNLFSITCHFPLVSRKKQIQKSIAIQQQIKNTSKIALQCNNKLSKAFYVSRSARTILHSCRFWRHLESWDKTKQNKTNPHKIPMPYNTHFNSSKGFFQQFPSEAEILSAFEISEKHCWKNSFFDVYSGCFYNVWVVANNEWLNFNL